MREIQTSQQQLRRGLWISVREQEYVVKEKFWSDLNTLVKSGKVNSLGVSTISPYGLTYQSRKFKNFIAEQHFFPSFVYKFNKLAKKRKLENFKFFFWCSLLFNLFFKGSQHQVNLKKQTSEDFICLNSKENLNAIKDIFDDIARQKWFDTLKSIENLQFGLELDAVQFYDSDYCLCPECQSLFEKSARAVRISYDEITRYPLLYLKWLEFRRKSLVDFLGELTNYLRKKDLFNDIRVRFLHIESEPMTAETSLLKFGEDFEEILSVKGLDGINVQLCPYTGIKYNKDPQYIRELQRVASFLSARATRKNKETSLVFEGLYSSEDINLANTITKGAGLVSYNLVSFSEEYLQDVMHFLALQEEPKVSSH